MELLDRVKQVESEVAREAAKARSDAEREVASFREDCGRKSALKVGEGQKQSVSSVAVARSEAELEARAILEGANDEAGRITKSSGRRMDSAVSLIVQRLGG